MAVPKMTPEQLAAISRDDTVGRPFGMRTPALEVVRATGVSLAGKVVVITGGANGIGKETSRAIAQAGAHTILAVRNLEQGNAAAADITATTGNAQVEVMLLDLDNFDGVRTFATAFLARNLPLHILINNAGIMACPERKTKDGFESQFATNHYSHFLLTHLLMPCLLAAKPSRVISVSSVAHRASPLFSGALNFDDLNFETTPYNKWQAYGASKCANILFAKEGNRLFAASGVEFFTLHPGGISTGLQKDLSVEEMTAFGWILPDGSIHPGFKTLTQGASTTVYAAVAPELAGKGGSYLEDCTVRPTHTPQFTEVPENAIRLWEISEKNVGVSFRPAADADTTGRPFVGRTPALEVVKGMDLSGKVAIVTGGASGIGKETSRALAVAGARVIMAVRNMEQGQAAAAEINAAGGGALNISAMHLDLSTLASVKAFAAAFLALDIPLNILINNAGIMAGPFALSADGIEAQFATNHLAHMLLVKLLLEKLQASKPARVVCVSSIAHRRFNPATLEDVNCAVVPYDKWAAYGRSKWANLVFAKEAQRRWGATGVEFFTLHPGGIFTGLQKDLAIEEMRALGWLKPDGTPMEGFKSVTQGASTSVYAAVSPDLDGKGGSYLDNCTVQPTLVPALTEDLELASKLWAVSEELLLKHA